MITLNSPIVLRDISKKKYTLDLKLPGNYIGYEYDGYYALFLERCSNLTFRLSIDGDKANIPQENQLILMRDCHNITFEKSTFRNANYKVASLNGSPSENIIFDRCTFEDNGDLTGNDSDFYCDNQSSYTFTECIFSRQDIAVSNGQAFYSANGFGTYFNNKFQNIPYPYDFRNGHHVVIGGHGDTCYNAIITQGGNPFVVVNGFNATNCLGHPGDTVAALWLTAGTTSISSSKFQGSGTNAWYGARVRNSAANCSLNDVELDGFTCAGIITDGTAGGHLLDHPILKNVPIGIRSMNNTGRSWVRNAVFSSVATQYDNQDNELEID